MTDREVARVGLHEEADWADVTLMLDGLADQGFETTLRLNNGGIHVFRDKDHESD